MPAICKTALKVGVHFFFSFLSVSSFSQVKNAGSVLLNAMHKLYMNGVGGAANLYSGAEYEGPNPGVLGSPFWAGTAFQRGFFATKA